jgi:hypothetical protein
MVLAGKPADGAWRFSLQIGIARHWFFRVPKGTGRFVARVEVADSAHVLSAEVHAPDRLMEHLYVRGGQPTGARAPLPRRQAVVEVPRGLDGKIWFLRLSVGSATRFLSDDVRKPRRVRIDADIELRGVPGYLAPTWEQWFQPSSIRD